MIPHQARILHAALDAYRASKGIAATPMTSREIEHVIALRVNLLQAGYVDFTRRQNYMSSFRTLMARDRAQIHGTTYTERTDQDVASLEMFMRTMKAFPPPPREELEAMNRKRRRHAANQ